MCLCEREGGRVLLKGTICTSVIDEQGGEIRDHSITDEVNLE